MRDYLYVLIIAAVVTYLLTPLARRASIATGALHAPRGRDVHEKPTPLLGGVAMYGGLVVGLLVAERLSYLKQAFPSSRTVTGLLLAGGLLVLIGALDDRFGMGVISRLAAQIAAAGILMWSGVYLPWVPLPGGQIFSLEPDLSATLTILIVVLTVNAVNFIDGLDGLAAGVVAIAGLSYLVYSYTLANSVGIPSQSVPIDWRKVIFNMITLKGIYGREMYETWYLMTVMLESGLDISPVITHRLPWYDYEQGFAAMRAGDAAKVILDWQA